MGELAIKNLLFFLIVFFMWSGRVRGRENEIGETGRERERKGVEERGENEEGESVW